MANLEDKFIFWCPIEKANDIIDPTTGETIMRLGGIASTSDEDSDGEFLDPKGFDIKPLLSSGMVNWHHQAKGQPATIIGEPTKAEIRAEGLYIETDLYPSSKIACDVWELAETLEKDSKTRRLGYSIEGKVVKRKSNNKNSPDYKIIQKAIITGVAVTHQPKNPKTFANIIKGEIDDDFEEDGENEKALDTDNAASLKKESVEGKIKKQTLSKSAVMEILFKDIAGISIEKAEKIHSLILKIANMKKGKKQVTEEDISKAYEALGLDVNPNEDISKGEQEDEQEQEPIKKAKTKKSESYEDTDEEEESEDEEEEEEVVVKKGGVNRFDRLEKAIATSHQINSKYIKALGVMIKSVSNKANEILGENVELKEVIKAQEETISEMSDKLEQYASEVPAPKSLSNSRPVDRSFAKSNDSDFGDERPSISSNQLSISRQPGAVAEILDQAAFNKGYDEEFGKACTAFEAVKQLPKNIISRIKNEYGIEIVK